MNILLESNPQTNTQQKQVFSPTPLDLGTTTTPTTSTGNLGDSFQPQAPNISGVSNPNGGVSLSPQQKLLVEINNLSQNKHVQKALNSPKLKEFHDSQEYKDLMADIKDPAKAGQRQENLEELWKREKEVIGDIQVYREYNKLQAKLFEFAGTLGKDSQQELSYLTGQNLNVGGQTVQGINKLFAGSGIDVWSNTKDTLKGYVGADYQASDLFDSSAFVEDTNAAQEIAKAANTLKNDTDNLRDLTRMQHKNFITKTIGGIVAGGVTGAAGGAVVGGVAGAGVFSLPAAGAGALIGGIGGAITGGITGFTTSPMARDTWNGLAGAGRWLGIG